MPTGLKKLALHVIASIFALLVSTHLVAAGGEVSRGSGPQFTLPTDAQKCIRPTEFMRKNHMNLLDHKRDQTMYDGIRTQDASIQGCVNCHAAKDKTGAAIPVNAPGQFCSSCHEYVSVKLDCFECHRTTPETILGDASFEDVEAHDGLLAGLANQSKVSNSLRNDLKNYLQGVAK